MHPSLRVTDRLVVTDLSVVVGFVFDRWTPAEAVHQPIVVVPGHPGAGGLLDVAEPGERACPKRWPGGGALGLVEPDRGLREGIVERVADGADRRSHPLQGKGLPEVHTGVMRPGVGTKPKSV